METGEIITEMEIPVQPKTSLRFMNVNHENDVVMTDLGNEHVYRIMAVDENVYNILGPFSCKKICHQIAGIAFDHVGNMVIGDSKHKRLLYFSKNQFHDNSRGKLLELNGFPVGLEREKLLEILMKPFPHFELESNLYRVYRESLYTHYFLSKNVPQRLLFSFQKKVQFCTQI